MADVSNVKINGRSNLERSNLRLTEIGNNKVYESGFRYCFLTDFTKLLL